MTSKLARYRGPEPEALREGFIVRVAVHFQTEAVTKGFLGRIKKRVEVRRRYFSKRVPASYIPWKTDQIELGDLGRHYIWERTSMLDGWTRLWLGVLCEPERDLHGFIRTPYDEVESTTAVQTLLGLGFEEEK